jgi:hypothetical protein
MNDKYKILVDECINIFPKDTKGIFKELSEYAISLGYMPKWVKVRVAGKAVNGDSLTFIKNKVKRTLMKIKPAGNWHNVNKPCLILTFFASSNYSDVFKQGIKRAIEEFEGRYTGCYGCGKCEKGKLQGYTYIYPEGKKVFRCGGALIELPPISADHIAEIKQLMKNQDDFFTILNI